MLRRIIQFFFRKPLLFILSKLHGSPNTKKINNRLSELLAKVKKNNSKCGITIDSTVQSKYVVISDVHKGSGDAADDFCTAEQNYVKALQYYLANNYTMIALGDIEELWENKFEDVLQQNRSNIELEKQFVQKNRFLKIFGNHDYEWTNNRSANSRLQKMYGKIIPIYEGIIINFSINRKKLDFFLTHGHQGDATSDGNKLSKWFVANVWNKVQAYLDIKINTPSQDFLLRNKHNKKMYEWSASQKNTILVTGHTHKPVFESLSHVERINKDLVQAKADNNLNRVYYLENELAKRKIEYIENEPYTLKKPTYFNTGCCCFNDGDITILEITNEKIELVKWSKTNASNAPEVFESIQMESLFDKVYVD